jgi:pimeloyl-ACP methyl ester carboxylesterase
VAVVVVILFAAGWYLSGLIGCRGFEVVPKVQDVEVLAVGDGEITLHATGEANECGQVSDDWMEDGPWGIEWDGGYGQVGDIRRLDEGLLMVVREFTVLEGNPPVGLTTRLKHPYPVDPTRAYGIAFEEITYETELGPMPAWLTAGDDDTWVIFVHGKGSSRTEAMRMLRTVHAAGFSGMAINYRNDPGETVDPMGKYQYGLTEWRDVEGAVRYALDNGAEDVVLVGYSMGGGIVMNFLYESELADVVRGAILDAPMADFGATVDFGIREFGVPGFLVQLPLVFASVRFGIDWEGMDYMARIDELQVPVLLLHGTEDQTVPYGIAEELAEKRPDLISFESFAGARHVKSWGTDTDRYEALVGEFLAEVAQ